MVLCLVLSVFQCTVYYCSRKLNRAASIRLPLPRLQPGICSDCRRPYCTCCKSSPEFVLCYQLLMVQIAAVGCFYTGTIVFVAFVIAHCLTTPCRLRLLRHSFDLGTVVSPEVSSH
ncbi:unnamed protein product [Parnassius mnemosyne]|uniref:Uncharacterized protein n=1 Tax=Parnassius mnemosyne TaxID=213953 RepID=A0AAV1KKM5_9NEOP